MITVGAHAHVVTLPVFIEEYFGFFNIFGLSYFTIYSSFHIFLLYLIKL